MDKVKFVFFRLIIVFLSLFLIDGGRSLYLVTDNIQVLLNHDNSIDIEVPHQHHCDNFSTDEKWIGSESFDFACHDNAKFKFSYTILSYSQDFSCSVWQPPRKG